MKIAVLVYTTFLWKINRLCRQLEILVDTVIVAKLWQCYK